MSESVTADSLSNLCRLCLAEGNVNELIPISLALSLRIMACTSLEITEDESLPDKICSECRYQLESAYRFRKKCKSVDMRLRRFIQQVEAGKLWLSIKDISDDENEDSEKIEFFTEIEQGRCDVIKAKRKLKKKSQGHADSRIVDETETFYKHKQRHEFESKYATALRSRRSKCSSDRELNRYDGLELAVQQITPDDHLFTIVEKSTSPKTVDDKESEDIQSEHDFYSVDSPEHDSGSQQLCTSPASPVLAYIINNELCKNPTPIDKYEFSLANSTNTSFGSRSKKKQLQRKLATAKDTTEAVTTDHNNDSNGREIQTDFSGMESDKSLNEEIENGNSTQVEVTLNDGSIIFMELETEQPATKLSGSPGQSTFKCKTCSKSFENRTQLQRHASVHTREKGYPCEHCNKWFPSKSSYTRHIRIHTGEKPFQCEYCHRSFVQKEILTRHITIHTGLKPYACDLCDKKFTQREVLRQHHNRKHSANPVIELHKCSLCTRSFCHASGLSRHLLVHSGRTFKCDYCPKQFNDKSAVKRHMLNLHTKSLCTI